MSDSDRVAALWQERAVERPVLRFGRCLDRGDWRQLRSCFTDVINVDFHRLTGQDEVRVEAGLWVACIERALSAVRRHHTYTNIDVTVEGREAHAVVYMTARHWAQTDIGVSHNTQYGWYDFYLQRSACEWLIRGYKHDFQWVDGNAGVLNVREPGLLELTNAVFTEPNFQAAKDNPLRSVS